MRDDDHRQDARPQRGPRRHHDLQQSRRGITPCHSRCGRRRANPRRLRRRRRGAGCGAHGRGRQGVRVGRGHLQVRVRAATREAVERYNAIGQALLFGVGAFAKPTIAAIQGYSSAAASNLALACDLRFCTQGSRFGLPAARLGLGYGYDGLQRFIDTVGPAAHQGYLLLRPPVRRRRGLRMGVVNRVLPEAELDAFVKDYAATIAPNAPLTIGAVNSADRGPQARKRARSHPRCRSGRALLRQPRLHRGPQGFHGKAQAELHGQVRTRMSSDAGARHNRRELMLNALTMVVTIAVCLVAAEAVLRFLPVGVGFLHRCRSRRKARCFHFRPDHDFVFSKGLEHGARQPRPYQQCGLRQRSGLSHERSDAAHRRHRGFSYIEAFMVPFRETMQGRLAAALAGRFRWSTASRHRGRR